MVDTELNSKYYDKISKFRHYLINKVQHRQKSKLQVTISRCRFP